MTQTATEYEVVIGLEVHCQVLTRTKMFCGCSADDGGVAENRNVCPVCLGLPGTLPVVNRDAVEKTVLTGLALNCTIPAYAKFDRKNYPYPDLMKGYQISQYDLPFCVAGWLDVEVGGARRRVGITRVHLEEDTARLRHEGGADGEGYSLIDVNRSGVPLMEIVSEPDMRSPEEAREYLVRLRAILRATGVSKANMEEGNFRCDANVSLRPIGATAFGTKVEIKNMNSFRAVQRAIEYEIGRQGGMLDRGEPIRQETRGWVEGRGETVSQRSKEMAHDYRYFPEPDLPPFAFEPAWVEGLRARLPELPGAMRDRFIDEYGLSEHEAGLLTESAARAAYFERALAQGGERGRRAKGIADWMLNQLASYQNADGREIDDVPITPERLAEFVERVEAKAITTTAARQVFERMYATGAPVDTVIEELGLGQPADSGELEGIVARVIAENAKIAADYRGGKTQAMSALIGPVMKQTKGRFDAGLVRATLERMVGQG